VTTLKSVQNMVRRRTSFAGYLFSHLSILLITAMLISGCSPTKGALKPIYPTLDENAKKSVLILENKDVAYSFFHVQERPNLYVEIDGFSPTSNETIPVGTTKLHVSAGTHEITHKGVSFGSNPIETKRSNRDMEPIATHFSVEEGKTYIITFEFYKESFTRIGYKIHYKGWGEKEMAQWPERNMIDLL
jgi:hypothetical protein